MLHLGQTNSTLRVVSDQVGTPTYTPDLARLLVDMVETEKYGTYHATNEGGYISWYDFCLRDLLSGGVIRDHTARDDGGIRLINGSSPVQQPAG